MSSPTAASRLRPLRFVALADVVLLVALVTASTLDIRPAVSILGPVHGANVLFLVAMAANGAGEGMWSWFFPIGIAATGGPLGAFIGELLIRRRLRLESSTPAPSPPSAPPVAVSLRTPLLYRVPRP